MVLSSFYSETCIEHGIRQLTAFFQCKQSPPQAPISRTPDFHQQNREHPHTIRELPTVDITSLYTNIPNQEGISSCRAILECFHNLYFVNHPPLRVCSHMEYASIIWIPDLIYILSFQPGQHGDSSHLGCLLSIS